MKKLIVKTFPPKARGLYRLRRRSALDEWGWYASIKNGFSCDEAGRPLPWISYSALAVLRSRINQAWDVFEFGAGYSTLWWAERCHSVTSCEHDADWCARITQLVPKNCTVIPTVLSEDYPFAAKATRKVYDVIVVDGRERVKCALNSVPCLKAAGIIVWDDTERDRYQDGLRELGKLGFKRIDLVGMSPLVTESKQTSFLYRTVNVLDL